MNSLVEMGRTGKIKCPSLEPTLSERPLTSSEWRKFGIKAANEIERLREALEHISRQNGKEPGGFIDWQRCVNRIQSVAKEALSIHEPGK